MTDRRVPLALALALALPAACIVEQDLGDYPARGGAGGGGRAGEGAAGAGGAPSSSGGAGATTCEGEACGGEHAIATGEHHSCVIVNGGVKCWGYDAWGLLGEGAQPGSVANIAVPVDVKDLSGVSAISANGDHTCALTSAGGVKCWGHNIYGYLGNGSLDEAYVPADVVGLTSGVSAVSAAESWTCALTAAGGVKCWGSNGSSKLLGDDDSLLSTVPVDRTGLLSGVAAVSAGGHHGCAVLSTSGVVCWGNNDSGQLGDGSWSKSTLPVDVQDLSGVVAVAAGGDHTCALTAAGGVKCWGENAKGQLGNNSLVDSPVPVDVSGLSSGVASIAAGKAQTCAVTHSGGVKCWGENGTGKLGTGALADSRIPADVSGLSSGAVAVSTAIDHTCALMASGGVKCWGNNEHYQLGTGEMAKSTVPVDVIGL